MIVESLPPQFKSIVSIRRKPAGSGRDSGGRTIVESATPQFGVDAKLLITEAVVQPHRRAAGDRRHAQTLFLRIRMRSWQLGVRAEAADRLAR